MVPTSNMFNRMVVASCLIKQTQVSTKSAEVVVPTRLNLSVWRKHLALYKHNRLIDYLEFGFSVMRETISNNFNCKQPFVRA